MTNRTQAPSSARGRKQYVVCEVDASSASAETAEAAVSYCRGRDVELVFLLILEPRLFSSPFPVAVGAVGTWGLPWTLRCALQLARAQGTVASSVVRVGERARVLAAEQEARQAEAVFPAAR